MQAKTIMRYRRSSVRMAVIKRTGNKCYQGCGKREPSDAVGGDVNWCNHHGKQNGWSLKS